MSRGLRPVVLSSEVIIFEGSTPIKDFPKFPTEDEAWEYIEEYEPRSEGDDDVELR